ncbi:glycosyl transferase family group 2-domain-containing protein [Lipomyces japonicus]|uniref:glycosyl transferase family group 2-domain-containing protein n=1 Tax=Lipomyces japonicus TaxID=56871 RepID=UPI0034CF668A
MSQFANLAARLSVSEGPKSLSPAHPGSRQLSSASNQHYHDAHPLHHLTSFENFARTLEHDRPLPGTGPSGSVSEGIKRRDSADLAVLRATSDLRQIFSENHQNDGLDFGGLDAGTLDKYDIMCQFLYKSCKQKHWIELLPSEQTPAIALRVNHEDDKGNPSSDVIEYRVFPPESENSVNSFAEHVAELNVEVCVRLSYPIINVLMSYLAPDVLSMPLSENTRIQVLEELEDLPRARKYQYSAFIRSEACLLVWADDVRQLLSLATLLETRMMDIVWSSNDLSRELNGPTVSYNHSIINEETAENSAENLKDVEANKPKRRPIMLLQAVAVGIAILILFLFIGLLFRIVAKEIKADGNYIRLLIILYIPPFVLFCAFFTIVVAGTIIQLIGPVSQLSSNSATYSAVKPPRLSASNIQLPHVTIQCPVYKETLDGVIDPTMQSLLAAITTYELQGGSANIFVNDDGMQLISEEEAEKRRAYYAEHLIGYVSRPPHGKDGFERRGRFKKASNMNYCLDISNRVEEHLQKVERHEKWTDREETEAYEAALESVLEAEGGKCWAAGDIRIGDLILLVDSDTRIPEDCFLDAASEFYHSPEVAIVQNKSGVMMVVFNYWEELIAWFTRLIYFAIQYATAGGDAAAFVGHNAFLRWSAVQEIAYVDETDNGRVKYWSEEHVSEDFEMSLKLQTRGYVVRLATYYDDQFQEGVSLTVYDELTRWQKYAYGCSELVFKPVRYWYTGKIFTPLFWRFLTSEMKTFAKFTIISYIGTYYAISASLLLTLVNYIVIGWFQYSMDQLYLSSFTNFLTLVVVFSGACPVANALVRYRTGQSTFWHALFENFKWGILMTIFLGGLSWHLNLALLSHMFSFNMQWGATAKELENSNFFTEFPKIMKTFKYMYLVVAGLMICMIVIAYAVPWNWRITGVYCGLPLGWNIASHMLSPIVLNPQLMTFSF